MGAAGVGRAGGDRPPGAKGIGAIRLRSRGGRRRGREREVAPRLSCRSRSRTEAIVPPFAVSRAPALPARPVAHRPSPLGPFKPFCSAAASFSSLVLTYLPPQSLLPLLDSRRVGVVVFFFVPVSGLLLSPHHTLLCLLDSSASIPADEKYLSSLLRPFLVSPLSYLLSPVRYRDTKVGGSGLPVRRL